MKQRLESLQLAKRELIKQFGGRAWFRGAGIAPGKSGPVLRLNVDRGALEKEDEVPHKFLGATVEIVFISHYRPRAELVAWLLLLLAG